jgi:hypothetical protein
MKNFKLALGIIALAVVTAGNAEAALLNVVKGVPFVDFSSSNTWLIYDHNAVNSTTGTLKVATIGMTLGEGVAAGGSSVNQNYIGGSDQTAALVMSFNLNNTTGALVGGSVNIGFGNQTTTTAPVFSLTGTVTDFGFSTDSTSTRSFDAKWTVTNDQYQNMPANMNQFVNGFLTGINGGVISIGADPTGAATNAFGTSGTSFANDWVFGGTAGAANFLTNAQYGTLLAGLDTNAIHLNAIVSSSASVPVPAAAWLMSSALLGLFPSLRKKKSKVAA